MSAKFVTKTISENIVVVFSKTTCPFCVKAKKVLDSIGVKYVVIELNQRSDGSDIQRALEKLTGQRTVPNVFINGKSIGGGSETAALHAKGKLVPLLKEAGAQL